MTASTSPLTAQDVAHLHEVLTAADKGATMRWVRDLDDEVRTGVARRVGPYDGNGHRDAPDVRDQFLHVSGMVEMWLPVMDVVAMLADRTLIFGKD